MKTHSETANDAHIKREPGSSPRQWIGMWEATEEQWHAD